MVWPLGRVRGTTVPDRALAHWPRLRKFAWPFTIGLLVALLILTLTLGALIRDARRDVSTLQAAGRTAEVATCYASARGRPQLIVILRLIAGLAESSTDPEIVKGAATVNQAVDGYDANTPSVAQCDMLARDRGLDPKDFPPPRPPGSRK